MNTVIVFFGKSQDFTTHFYDRNGHINDFNSIIRDFSLLESRIFTVDDITNKEMLARYFFKAQGKNYCLIKLYSFAQAFNGARVDGSTYGVGLLSDQAIEFSKENLGLLRSAKDGFAKLSLEGLKFNKSNFKSDSDQIWENICDSLNGNLLDKVTTFDLVFNGTLGQAAFYSKNLFEDAIKLNRRILSKDSVYLSEDLEHLKRTQQRWGKEQFSIHYEENGQFVQYNESVRIATPNPSPGSGPDVLGVSDESKLRTALEDEKYKNRCLEEDLEKLKKKQKRFSYMVYGLSGLIFLLLVLLFFFELIFPKEVSAQLSPVSSENTIDIGQNLADSPSREEMEVFVENISFIYSLDNTGTEVDTILLNEKYQDIIVFSSQFNFDIKKVREKFLEQKEKIGAEVSGNNQKTNKDSEARNEGN